MEKQMLNWRELNDQANPGRTPARPQRMVATLAESEDVLIADPRGQIILTARGTIAGGILVLSGVILVNTRGRGIAK